MQYSQFLEHLKVIVAIYLTNADLYTRPWPIWVWGGGLASWQDYCNNISRKKFRQNSFYEVYDQSYHSKTK